MRHTLSAIALSLAAASANATLTLCLGPGQSCPVQGGLENVLMPAVGTTGNTVVGETNQSHTPIEFHSTEVMEVTGSGQAKIEALDGQLGDIDFGAQQSTVGLLTAVFNIHAEADGNFHIRALDNEGTTFDFGQIEADDNGENWMRVGSLDNQFIRRIYIAGTGIQAIDEFQQVRVDAANLPPCPDCEPNPQAVVPVPAAAWLFGSGLIGLGAVARRRSNGNA